jgi:hypothetical protein
MTDLIRRFRGAAIALVVLAISAGVAFAGGSMPGAADFGLQTATDASGQVVPARPQADQADEEDPSLDADDPATEPADDADADGAPDNHGTLVSEAARMDTPEAFDGRHGAFVSCVARMNHGHDDGTEVDPEAEPLVLADLTPEDCVVPGQPDPQVANAEARAEKAAEKAAAKAARAALKAQRAADRAGG